MDTHEMVVMKTAVFKKVKEKKTKQETELTDVALKETNEHLRDSRGHKGK